MVRGEVFVVAPRMVAVKGTAMTDDENMEDNGWLCKRVLTNRRCERKDG